MMIKRFVVILVFLFTLTGCTANNDTMTDTNTEANIEINTETVEVSIEYQKLSTEEKVEDFEFLFDTLSSNYPYFEMNKRLYAVDWLGILSSPILLEKQRPVKAPALIVYY